MSKDTNHPPNAEKGCIACGERNPASGMEPFGTHAGRIVSWVCGACAVIVPAKRSTPLRGAPALAWTTIARADRLAVAGAGRTTDHVMRQALALLEERHFAPKGGQA